MVEGRRVGTANRQGTGTSRADGRVGRADRPAGGSSWRSRLFLPAEPGRSDQNDTANDPDQALVVEPGDFGAPRRDPGAQRAAPKRLAARPVEHLQLMGD